MAVEVVKVSKNNLSKAKDIFKQFIVPSTTAYGYFSAKTSNCSITAYTSGKIVFQGKNPIVDANKLNELGNLQAPKEKKPTIEIDPKYETFIGSDEVGNGSYFGDFVVCSAFIPKENLDLIKELGVGDSKSLSDKKILELYPKVKDLVLYSFEAVTPKEYNDYNENGVNANGIKTIVHNKVMLQVERQLNDRGIKADGILLDAFTTQFNYNKHLRNNGIRNSPNTMLFFEEKAESRSITVACASIIARAIFLFSLDEYSRLYGVLIPSGATPKAIEIGKELVSKYGSSVLRNTGKLCFRTTQQILD